MEAKLTPDEGSWREDVRPGSRPLIFSFGGLGDQFEFHNTLKAMDVNVVYLRDLSHHWYLTGVTGVGADVMQVAGFLEEKRKALNPPRVIMLGASAGGFAALLFGSLIQADHIIAFTPQTFMNRLTRTLYYEHRWRDRVRQIYAGEKSNRVYLDVKPWVARFEGKVTLFYDQHHRLDNIHGRRLKSRNLERFIGEGGGHNLVTVMRDSGKLAEYLSKAIALVS